MPASMCALHPFQTGRHLFSHVFPFGYPPLVQRCIDYLVHIIYASLLINVAPEEGFAFKRPNNLKKNSSAQTKHRYLLLLLCWLQV